MQLIRHLNDEELTDLLQESEERDLRPMLNSLPELLRSATERPEWFWKKQQAAIRGRIAGAPQPWLRLVAGWAMTMALVALALVLLRRNPAPPAQQVQADPDQELLMAVEQSLQSDVPASLEPAALLAEEIGGRPASHSDIRKENHHAN